VKTNYPELVISDKQIFMEISNKSILPHLFDLQSIIAYKSIKQLFKTKFKIQSKYY